MSIHRSWSLSALLYSWKGMLQNDINVSSLEVSLHPPLLHLSSSLDQIGPNLNM